MICRPATRICRSRENKMSRIFAAGFFVPLALMASPAVAAGPFQDTASIDRAVAAFTGKGIGDLGGARSVVDARLKLAACPMVSMSWRTAGQDAVVVTCTGPEWRIFVPVRAMATPAVAPRAAAPVTIAPVKLAAVIKRGDPVMIAVLADPDLVHADDVWMVEARECLGLAEHAVLDLARIDRSE